MDMADAVNVMLHASPRKDGSPGCAVWDIYRAEDAKKIRHFLHEKFGFSKTDPIHSQHYYLDSVLRKELFEKEGVKSWRIYQKPGQAVFIPAGCAHQVSLWNASQNEDRRDLTMILCVAATPGVQPCRLHQGRSGLRQSGKYRPM